MRNRLWYELLRIPASTIIGVMRINVGMNFLPPWHFIVLCIPFFGAYAVTKIDGFLWCGAFIAFGLLVQGTCWITEYLKGKPIHPDAEGTSTDGEIDSDWREFSEPFFAICGALVALYYHQWILGAWIIFAGLCLALVANLQIVDEEIRLADTSFLAAEPPELTKPRLIAAFAIAIIIDLIQMPLTALEFTGLGLWAGEIADGVLDTLTAGATTLLLGFHWALLPSFMVEAVPGLDAIPTWTGCVAFVVWQRRKKDSSSDMDIDEDDDDEAITASSLLRAAIPAQTPPPPSVESQLKLLIDLRDKNLISQTEFEAKRQRILDEI